MGGGGGGGWGGGRGDSSVVEALVIERSRVRVPAGAAGDFFLLFFFFFSFSSSFLVQYQLSVPTLISISVPLPVLPQQHAKDPGHFVKSTGGMLQLNTHAPCVYIYGFT